VAAANLKVAPTGGSRLQNRVFHVGCGSRGVGVVGWTRIPRIGEEVCLSAGFSSPRLVWSTPAPLFMISSDKSDVI
jgi:hypothetical protein